MTEWVVHALLTADKVIEERNGKKAIIGVFDSINIDTFPSPGLPPWNIYAAIANLSDKEYKFAINITYDETNVAVFGVSGKLHIQDPSAPAEVVVPVSVMFPGAGTYTVSLHINGNEALSRVIRVRTASEQSGGETQT